MATNTNSSQPSAEESPATESFVETALKLGGKSENETRRTGAIDRADEQVEDLFAPKYQTSGSPVHQAVWDAELPVEAFVSTERSTSSESRKVMEDSLELVRSRRKAGLLLDENRKLTAETLNALAEVGYWGLLVDKEFGGSQSTFNAFARFLTRMATEDPTIAGLASVHGCIGAVDPVRSFGTPEQQRRYLPLLASGQRLSAFALTEPAAGSDLTALRTTAQLDGDHYVVNGEKLFITNAIPGRTIGLVCLIDNKPAVLIADLPEEENEHFQLVTYGLYALKHSYNNGLKFHNFRVPKENLLTPTRGDGLTIAYHGLNRGRVALCANAAGTMRAMLANMLTWAGFRQTYGAPIDTRELVQRRVGRMAGLIVACDALTDWCSWLLDEGFRGEMECIVAKIFGSEAQKDASIELFMKTHGGRAFLHGHLFGDNVHEFLAPCIYEGEGEMLGMAFFKSLVKVHGKKYFEPIGKALHQAGIKQPNPANPVHAWALRKAVMPYIKWRTGQTFGGWRRASLGGMPAPLLKHAQFAADGLQRSRLEIDSLMRRHQLKLADRQCAMADLSQRIQDLIVMLTTSLYASRQAEETIQIAADVACQDLRHRVTGERHGGKYFRTVTKLGQRVVEGQFRAIAGLDPGEILMPYENED